MHSTGAGGHLMLQVASRPLEQQPAMSWQSESAQASWTMSEKARRMYWLAANWSAPDTATWALQRLAMRQEIVWSPDAPNRQQAS